MIQEYSSRFYQPCTVLTDPKSCIIKTTLDLTESPFESYDILKLELILPYQVMTMNITIIEGLIYNIPKSLKFYQLHPLKTIFLWIPNKIST